MTSLFSGPVSGPLSGLRSAARFGAPLGLLLLAACGYTTGLEAPGGAASVGVELFANDGPVRNLEVELSDRVSRLVAERVRAPLKAPGRAELVVRGKILDYHRRGGTRSPDNELLETGVRINVEASLVERSTGRVVRTTRFGQWAGYAIGPESNELDARDRVLDSISERLVLDLFRPGDYEEEPETGAGAPGDGTDGPTARMEAPF